MVLVALQIEDEQFEVAVEFRSFEDILGNVGGYVGNAFLLRALERGFDGFTGEAFGGLFS